MTVIDRFGRDFAVRGTAGPRSRDSGALAGAMLGTMDPPWLAASASEAELGFASPAVGPWGAARPEHARAVVEAPIAFD